MVEQVCASCGKALDAAVRGRPKRYCSRACQARAYRERRAVSPDDVTADGTPQLTVDRIVRAGIALADAAGLDALTMRQVAMNLGTGTMSLYRYVASKDELIALMVEVAMADVPLPGSPPRDWRHGLEQAAYRDWELYHRHPWILPKVSISTRGRFSPAVAADSEHALSSFDGLGLEPEVAFRYMFLFASYVQGVALTYVGDVEAARQQGNPETAAPGGAGNPLFADGAYPRLASAMQAGAEPWDLDALFASGLAGVLDGIEADLKRRGARLGAGNTTRRHR